MKRLALALVLSIGGAACSNNLPFTPEPTNQIQAQFNPAASPPVLPTPTDLAANPTTHLLNIPIDGTLGLSDQTILLYLNSLTGYPSDSPAEATFSGSINPSTLAVGSTVLVVDETAGFARLDAGLFNFSDGGSSVTYVDSSDPSTTAPLMILPAPVGGWIPGHIYDLALTNGIQGAMGETVLGTPTFALIRSTTSLVTPAGCNPSTCASVTSLIPNGADAFALEQIRREYAPVFAAFETAGTPRANIPLLWRFSTSNDVMMDFNPNGPSCPPNVPSPNFLAQNPVTGQVGAPACPNYTPAQLEFTNDYLNNLLGFPVISPGEAPVIHGDLDEASIGASIGTIAEGDGGSIPIPNVLVLDITPTPTADGGSVVIPSLVPGLTPSYAAGELTVPPPATGWSKGHQYAMAVMSGMPGGVTNADGGPVVSNDQFALLESQAPLSLCTIADGGTVTPTPGTTCPSALTQVILTDAQATQAELVREGLAPILALIQAVTNFPTAFPDAGLPSFYGPMQPNNDGGNPLFEGGIAMAWAFGVTAQAEVNFNLSQDATAAIVPFPNDLLFTGFQGDGGHVAIPNPTNDPTIGALDTLDGFSLTAPATAVTNQLQALDALTDGVHVLTQPGGPDGGGPWVAVSANDGGGQPAGIMVLQLALPDAGQPPVFEAVTVCVNCDSTPNPDGGGYASDALQILPAVPLPESTPYAAFVQTSLMGDNGLPVAPSLQFALLRMANPLLGADGGSTVSGLSAAQAQQLEPLREQFAPLFDVLASAGIPRSSLAMAWNYHTQSVVSQLAGLYSLPSGAQTAPLFPVLPEYAVPIDSLFTPTITPTDGGAPTSCNSVGICSGPGVLSLDPLPYSNLAHIVAGSYYSQNLLTGTEGTFNPNPADWKGTRVPFVLTLPKGTPPTGGWPVVIFGHGITRSRLDMLSLANTYAGLGFAVEAEDIIFHGDRSVCVGAGAFVHTMTYPDGGNMAPDGGDNFACHDPIHSHCDEDTTSYSYGRCVGNTGTSGTDLICAGSQLEAIAGPGVPGDLFCFGSPFGRNGFCAEDPTKPLNTWHCEGGDWHRVDPTTGADDLLGQPLISGWDILSVANLFETRDNLRQQIVDLAQAEQVLVNASTEESLPDGGMLSFNDQLAAVGVDPIDGTHINYTGQSLGGILGTLFTSVSTTVQNSVLNVAGGGFVQILQTSPAFSPVLEEFQAGYAAQGITPGSAAYDTLIHTAEWILDDDDPRVAAEYLMGYQSVLGGPAPANRNVLGLYIAGDQVVTTPAEQAENYCAMNSPEGANPFSAMEFVPASTTTDPTGRTSGLDLGDRHGFLLNFTNPGITAEAQCNAAEFVLTGAKQPNECQGPLTPQ